MASLIRWSSMKPVILPIRSRGCLLPARSRPLDPRLRSVLLAERPPVLVREDLRESAARFFPVIEDRERAGAPRKAQMALDERAQLCLVALSRMQDASFAGSR